MEENRRFSPVAIGVIIVLAIILIGYGAYRYANSEKALEENPIVTPIDTTGQTVPAGSGIEVNPDDTVVSVSSKYKNGTYSATGDYVSPGGAEQIDVTVTLKNDVITDATVVSKAFRPNSIHYQGLFISGYKALVIGKNIDDVQLDKVSGSSLAPKGFNEALAEIKTEAKV
jgi:uncharacterized protein with FMN-binding domain